MTSTTLEQQLLILRDLTSKTNAIHDAQRLQVAFWAGIAFGKRKWKTEINIENKTITFSLLEKKRRIKSFPQLVSSLEMSINWLLGEDWSIVIKEKSEVIYRGKNGL